MYEFNMMNFFLPYLVNLNNIISISSIKYYYKYFCTLSEKALFSSLCSHAWCVGHMNNTSRSLQGTCFITVLHTTEPEEGAQSTCFSFIWVLCKQKIFNFKLFVKNMFRFSEILRICCLTDCQYYLLLPTSLSLPFCFCPSHLEIVSSLGQRLYFLVSARGASSIVGSWFKMLHE